MHIFTFLRRKAAHGEAGLSSLAYTFRAVQVGKLTGKATVGFTTQCGPFYFNWLYTLSFLARQEGQSLKLGVKTELKHAASDQSSNQCINFEHGTVHRTCLHTYAEVLI